MQTFGGAGTSAHCPELCVGAVSADVRDEPCAALAASTNVGMAVLTHPADREQGFQLRTAGTRGREPVGFHGLALITSRESQEMANPL
ncbi:type I-E CRISPR-associated endoribonuclease Cas2 [Streptomyces sp. NPDC060198]|uniref:type I-E CRISPR-associated endoribonuclease Cas2 n=1 Tax=Streptomyces sp. NPDC060198 TaxID=3347070 RepID=UPI00364F838D